MILSGHYLYKDQQFDLDLWPCDLKINRGHLHILPKAIHSTKFGNFQAIWSKDIELTLLGLQTVLPSNQPQGAKLCLLFQRGSWYFYFEMIILFPKSNVSICAGVDTEHCDWKGSLFCSGANQKYFHASVTIHFFENTEQNSITKRLLVKL